MTLPAFATLEEFAVRLPAGVSEDDEPRAQAALDDASALIRAEAGRTWVTENELEEDVPDILLTVCVAAARRAFTNPDGVRSESLGIHSASFTDASADVYLTANERRMVKLAAGKNQVAPLGTTRGPLEAAWDADVLDPAVEELPIGFA